LAKLLGRVLGATTLFCGGMAALGTTSVQAQDVPYLGETTFVAFAFCPAPYWVEARGQFLSISTNQALFRLLGTTYGGDGRVTFALPDLRGAISTTGGPQEEGASPGQGLRSSKKRKPGGPPKGGEPGATEGQPLLACIAVEGIFPPMPSLGRPRP
jgi:microcystin-dependent protein